MKIGIIQASSQKNNNKILSDCTRKAAESNGHEIINFGVFEEEEITYSYVETAFCISLLLESKAIDFIVTGCSSGQGMMLACNSLPGVLCGYVANPSDAYLFGRINNGNAISYPLGLNFGWAAEINLQSTLDSLFKDSFGMGYPQKDAERKRKDSDFVKRMKMTSQKALEEVLFQFDQEFVKNALRRKNILNFVLNNGRAEELVSTIKHFE